MSRATSISIHSIIVEMNPWIVTCNLLSIEDEALFAVLYKIPEGRFMFVVRPVWGA